MGVVIGGCREPVGLPHQTHIFLVVKPTRGHTLNHFRGHRGRVVILGHHAEHGLVMAAGEGDFIVVTWYHAHFREQGTGGLVTGVRGRGGVCDALTFQVGYFMDVGIDVGVDLKRVAELPGV